MGMVIWEGDNVDESQLEPSADATVAILQMDEKQLAGRWKGKLIANIRAEPRVSVELRRHGMVIKIHDERMARGENRMVNISMGETVRMTPENIAEMKLAIDEGIAVYRLPDHWVKINTAIENRNKRRQKKRAGSLNPV